ncbi:hypothetical protein [Bradyrhizobium diazoefficiens]|uniref:hypothetical protein n=1 Tax=Bradyrhizobium diazoefficiens TaxID=1355477 RepID=UPI001B78E14B|nr:hypothetical protein [Bradyrhizobium japonicum]
MAKIKRSQRVNVLGPFRGKRPSVDIAHRRSFLERAFANGFDRVAAAAFLLKDHLALFSCLAEVGGLDVHRQAQEQSDAEAESLSHETRCHLSILYQDRVRGPRGQDTDWAIK